MLPVDGKFLPLLATSVGGGIVELPGDIPTEWGIVLGYRAHW